MSDTPPKKAKRVFKRLKLQELSLVDEPCVPGSDVVVIKAKPSTGAPESGSTRGKETDRGSGEVETPDPQEVRKRLEPFGALNDALTAKKVTPEEFVSKARAMIAELENETRTAEEPVNKVAAATAASIIAETTMDLEQMQAALNEANTAIDAVKVANDALTAEVATLKARNAELEEEVAKAKAKPEETSEEEVLKALPESLRTIVTKAKETVAAAAAAEEKRVEDAAVAKAKKLGVSDPAAFGKAMVEVAKAAPEAAKTIEAALEQASGVVDTSEVFKSLGFATTDAAAEAVADPEAALNAKAEEIRKAKPELTKEQAFDAAMEANPALYSAYVTKRRPGAAAH